MRIPVVSAVGHGATLLSSFDAALVGCGIHDYNLLVLSSVIPPGSSVERADRHRPDGDEHGHRLYVVRADERSDVPGVGLAAGVGWYQWADGRGVFVEHEIAAGSEAAARQEVRSLLCASLRDLCAARGVPFDERRVGLAVEGATVGDRPTTVLVAAVFEAEGWRR